MKANKVIHVFFDKKLVGTLAFTPSHKVAFEYCDDWLQNGFSFRRKNIFMDYLAFFQIVFRMHGGDCC